MTNLEAMLKAMGYQGGTIHQVDRYLRPALDAAGLHSISELDNLYMWTELLRVAVVLNAQSDEYIKFGHIEIRSIQDAITYRFDPSPKEETLFIMQD